VSNLTLRAEVKDGKLNSVVCAGKYSVYKSCLMWG